MEDSAGTGVGVVSASQVHREIQRRKGIRQIFFWTGILLLAAELLFLLLYFTLPSFRLKSRDVEGNEFLSNEDLLVLSQESPSTSFLFYDGETGAKKLTSYSSLVLSASESSSPFGASLTLMENVPFFSYQGAKYFKNGETLEEVTEALDETPLSQDRKTLLQASYSKAMEQDLTELHLPQEVSSDQISKCFSFLVGLPNSLRSSFRALQFRSDSGDSCFADVFDLILSDSSIDGYVLFPSLLYDQVPILFRHPSRLQNAFQSIEANIKAGKLTASTYTFEDEASTLSNVYTVHVSVTEDSVLLYR